MQATLPAPKKNGMLPGGKLPNTTLAPIRMGMAMRSIRMEYDVLYWGAQKVMAKTAAMTAPMNSLCTTNPSMESV